MRYYHFDKNKNKSIAFIIKEKLTYFSKYIFITISKGYDFAFDNWINNLIDLFYINKIPIEDKIQ
jgi:hypothetical protein